MTRYAIDTDVALRLIREHRSIPAPHRLVAPAVLRSDVLDALYREARAGRLDDREARVLLDSLAQLPVRLLGDRVSRATAWRLARDADRVDIRGAEYLAVARLQADVLVTEDAALREAAIGIVETAGYDDLPA
jgi:predicted nucleic acid-binding protein